MRFYGKTILFADSTFLPSQQGCYRVDFLVISGTLHCRMDSMLNVISPGMIILDASNPVRMAHRRMTELKGNVPVYSVADSGAFVYTYGKAE